MLRNVTKSFFFVLEDLLFEISFETSFSSGFALLGLTFSLISVLIRASCDLFIIECMLLLFVLEQLHTSKQSLDPTEYFPIFKFSHTELTSKLINNIVELEKQ